MKKQWLVIMLSSFLVIGLSSASSMQDFDEQVLKGKELIAEGADKWDDQIILDARTWFEKLLETGEMTWLMHYYIGYVDFRLATYYRTRNKEDLQLKYLDDGIEHFYASLDLNQKFPESHALLSLLLGQKARMDSSQTAGFGMEALAAITDARELGQENPRVAMISGIVYFFTPEQFGGSKTRAMEEIKRSVLLFETWESEDQRLPDWGHSDALTWQARLYMEMQQFELAQQSVEEALKVSPRNRFAKGLKLQLEQQASQR